MSRQRGRLSSGILRFVLDNDLFLPEPEPREVRYTVISVDDHVVEPAHTFEGRVPAALADRAPRIVETPEGHQVWEFEGQRYTQVGMNAVAEIRRNAERGFTSVTFPERPHEIGLPSLWDRAHWDPIMEAVVDTDTVVSLHVGSSGLTPAPPGAGMDALQLGATLFGQLSLTACAEWLWSGYALRLPDLKIAMSEGGIGWVAMLRDRLDNIVDRSRYGLGWDVRPAEVLQRNFWFCTIDDPSTIDTRHAIGVDHIMVEVDYPHGDSTWPDTQDVIAKYWGHIPAAELRAMCCENAAALYRHPLPDLVLPR